MLKTMYQWLYRVLPDTGWVVAMTGKGQEPDDLQRFRPFLRTLAEGQLHSKLRKKIDPSDIVQQTMLQAVVAESQWRGQDDAAKAGWLKAILQNVLNGVARSFHRDCRDIDRELGLNSQHTSTSHALDVPADQTSPSGKIQTDEERAEIARVIGFLTEEQRRAMVLRYWHDRSLSEIAREMGKSPDAVAGLLYRAMKVLRSELG